MNLLSIAIGTCAASAWAQEPARSGPHPLRVATPRALLKPSSASDNICRRIGVAAHSVGNVAFEVSNLGYLGVSGGDPIGVCTVPEGVYGIEFPTRSKHDYGGLDLLVGGVRGQDTLISANLIVWSDGGAEWFPTECDVDQRASTHLASDACFAEYVSDSAKSDHDLLSRYEDTLTHPLLVRHDPIEGRVHKPLGLAINQTSYSWAAGSASDFVIVEYNVKNVGVPSDQDWQSGSGLLRDMYVGLHTYPRAVYGAGGFGTGFDDNYVEFIASGESRLQRGTTEQYNTMLVADSDGDPTAGGFTRTSVPDVLGIAVLMAPTKKSSISFNWFVSQYWSDPSLDWGPVKRFSKVEFRHGGLGTPLGDRAFYQLLSNGEIDYSQLECALHHDLEGWLPPSQVPGYAADIAGGHSVSALVSVGPFDLPRDSSVTFAIAVVGGRDFHTDPANYRHFFDPIYPGFYRSRLDESNLLRNVQWAKFTYDNPGIDTDGDGFAGEYYIRNSDTVYYRGDGVPDIRAALPPRTPHLDFHTRAGRIAIRWNGHRTETEPDVFTQRADFEGYRVYMSRTAREDEWSFLTQRDLFNIARFTWNKRKLLWEMIDPPFTVDSLAVLYDTLSWSRYGFPFHPDSFKIPLLERALLEVHFDPDTPERLDSVYRYFVPYEANTLPDDVGLSQAVDGGADITGVIRKMYPASDPLDTAYREDGTPFLTYYEYEYMVKDIQVAEPVFLSVTAFDHGDPASSLEPLESAKSLTSQEVWPINSAEVIKSQRPKPGVYPNPYRALDAYFDQGWENRLGLEPDRDRARQVTFYNVPDTCTVSIWSLDGDLVRRIHHSSNPSSSEATVVRWDLITRNTQAVKTGIYIWSVESRFGTDVGKLVILK